MTSGLDSAVIRYRVVAWVTGTFLVVLCCAGLPLRYIADQPAVVNVVGPLHGALFIVYLLTAYDVIRRMRWPLRPSVAVLLAGTVPFLTFVAERYVSARVRERQAPGLTPAAEPGPSRA